MAKTEMKPLTIHNKSFRSWKLGDLTPLPAS